MSRNPKGRTGSLLLLLPLVAILFSPASAVEVYFTPGKDCESRIIAGADSAKKEIVASVYSINNSEIVNALVRAHKRGVKLRLLTDKTQATGPSSRALELFRNGLDIRVHTKHKIEHNKFGVFDDRVAVSGSYNWTKPASDANSENCVIMNEASAISAFKKRFNALWKMNTADGSLKALKKIEAKRARKLASKRSSGARPQGARGH